MADELVIMSRCSRIYAATRLSVGLLVLVTTSLMNALGAPAIAVGSTAGAPGGTATVPIYLSGNTRGVAAQFDLAFDANRIALASAVGGGGSPNHILASGQPTNGVLRVVLYSLTNSLLGNGVLINLRLTILPAAPESVMPIQVTNALLADVTAASVQPLTLQAGSLLISLGAGSRLASLNRSAGQVQFQLIGPADKRYVIQGSPDLSSWIDLATNVLAGGQITITDTTATNLPQRFYRARYAP